MAAESFQSVARAEPKPKRQENDGPYCFGLCTHANAGSGIHDDTSIQVDGFSQLGSNFGALMYLHQEELPKRQVGRDLKRRSS